MSADLYVSVRTEVEYRLRTVAAYFRMRGKHNETPDPFFLQNQINQAASRLLGLLTTPDGIHRPVNIWQERTGEVSWKCACGTVYKHQALGVVNYRCEP